MLDDLAGELTDLIRAVAEERGSYDALGIDEQEKAFYDILHALAVKYDFTYPHEKLIALAKDVKVLVDDKTRYTDWSERDDIKAEMKVDLILKYGLRMSENIIM